VAAVVQERKERRRQPAERTDAEDHVQEQQRGGAEPADDERFRGRARIDERTADDEQGEVEREPRRGGRGVQPLLAVPLHGDVAVAHGAPSAATGTERTTRCHARLKTTTRPASEPGTAKVRAVSAGRVPRNTASGASASPESAPGVQYTRASGTRG